MRQIDLQSWSRRQHFELFNQFDHPHFSLCANVEVGEFITQVKPLRVSLTASISYALARVANEIPEFRYRIHGDAVIEHDVVHPSFTMLTDGEIFNFCTVNYSPDFEVFSKAAIRKIKEVKEYPAFSDKSDTDDLLFMTAIPWVSFTNFKHPMHLNPADSVPRFAWGKIFEERGRMLMPLDVQVHHALMDGLHVGRFYNRLEELLNNPGLLIN